MVFPLASCEYCGLDGYYGRELARTRHWIIYLAPSQRYLGACVVALRRKCRDLSELSGEEWADFAGVLRGLESALRELFNPDLFNWSCFKNSAFRSEDPDPEVHWHFHPRYRRSVSFAGETFIDREFGHIPLPIEVKVPGPVMDELEGIMREMIGKHLSSWID
ncbi:HIT family protein [Methanothermobacter thermautotrophicus]|uniref:HIT family protein n=1 Tax=Methanothermobacter thermautotrophicus TaxID=145262 RepID=A0A842YP53_METTF|nr:HIT family protein [Methanothermobacter thermautotrophicus]